METKTHFTRYENILTDKEILEYALLINNFKHERINFSNLKNIFWAQHKITLQILTSFNLSIRKTLLKKEEVIRYLNDDYNYNDIKAYVLSSDEFQNVVFYMDRKAIELLANAGIPEYQKELASILMLELRLTSDKDQKTAAERRQRQKRIIELEEQLSKENETKRKLHL